MGDLIRNSEGDVLLTLWDSGFGTVNMAKMETLCFGLWEARHLYLCRIMVEGNYVCY